MDRRNYGREEVWWSEIHPSRDKVKVNLEECNMNYPEENPCEACKYNYRTGLIKDATRRECEGLRWYDCDWVVCDLCRGRGYYVNPGIDEYGITAEEFDEDPEFAENYHQGMFNVKCTKCSGRTTIPEIATSIDTMWILNQIQQIADQRNEWIVGDEAERRVGA